MNESRLKRFWHKIDGPLGALFVFALAVDIGYTVRGFEDGGLVATLIGNNQTIMARIPLARADERKQCDAQLANITKGFQERAKLRDDQVGILAQQYKDLADLVRRGAWMRADAARKAQEAANAAREAAASSKQAADNASVAKENGGAVQKQIQALDKKIDNATLPAAKVQAQPWVGNRKLP